MALDEFDALKLPTGGGATYAGGMNLPEVPAWQPPPKPNQFKTGLKAGFEAGLPRDIGNTIQTIGEQVGSETITEAGQAVERMGDTSAKDLQPAVPDLEAVQSFGDLTDWLSYTLGQGIASSSPSLAGGILGAGGGAAVGGPVGAVVGGLGGAAVPAFAQNFGQMRQVLEDAGITDKDQLAEAAAAGAIPMALLDAAFPGRAGSIIMSAVGGETRKTLLRKMGELALEGAATEGVTEAGQQSIQNVTRDVATGAPVTVDSATEGTLESAAAGAVTGGVLGGGVGGVSQVTSRPKPPVQEDAGEEQADPFEQLKLPAPEPQRALPAPREAAPSTQTPPVVPVSGTRGAPAPAGQVQQAVLTAARAEGIPDEVALGIVAAESAFNPSAQNPDSTAGGLYQHIDGTWLSQFKKHRKELEPVLQAKGYAGDLDRDTILSLRFDPEVSSILGAKLTAENKAALEEEFGQASPADLYAAHFLGQSGAKKLIRAVNENPDQAAADLFPAAAKSNRRIFYGKNDRPISVRALYARFQARMGRVPPVEGGQAPAVPEAVQQVPMAPPESMPDAPAVTEPTVAEPVQEVAVAPVTQPAQQSRAAQTQPPAIQAPSVAQTTASSSPELGASRSTVAPADRDFVLRVADKADSGKRLTVRETSRLTDLATVLGVELPPASTEGGKVGRLTIDPDSIRRLAAIAQNQPSARDISAPQPVQPPALAIAPEAVPPQATVQAQQIAPSVPSARQPKRGMEPLGAARAPAPSAPVSGQPSTPARPAPVAAGMQGTAGGVRPAMPAGPSRAAAVAGQEVPLDAPFNPAEIDPEPLADDQDVAYVPPSSFQRGMTSAVPDDFDRLRLASDVEGLNRRGSDYLAKREALAKDISALIARMVGDDTVAVSVNDMLLGEGDRITGAYSPLERLISISLESADPEGTAKHETIHALRDLGMIDGQKWRALKAAADKGDWIGKHKIRERYPEASQEMVYEEAIAEEFARYRRVGTTGNPTVDRIFQVLAEFLDAIRAAVKQQLGYEPTARDIFAAIDRGTLANASTAERGRILFGQQTDEIIGEIENLTGVRLTRDQIDRAGGSLFQRAPSVPHSPNVERILNKIEGDTSRPIGVRVREYLAGLKGQWALNAKQAIADMYAVVEVEEKAQYGKLLDASVSSYKSLRLTAGLPGIVNHVLRKGAIKLENGSIVERPGFEGGLDAILKPIRDSGEMKLFTGWMIATRAKRFIEEDEAAGRTGKKRKEKLLTRAEADEILRTVAARPELHDLFKKQQARWIGLNRSVLDFVEAAGVLDPEKRKIFDREDYIPFFRILAEDLEVKGPRGRRGVSDQRAANKRLTGSDQQINDVVENMVLNLTHLIDAGVKNIAAQRTVDLFMKDSGALTPVGLIPEKRHIQAGAAATALRNVGIDIDRLSGAERKKYIDIVLMTQPKAKKVISIMRDGKPEYYRVNDPLLLSAMTNLRGTQFEGAIMGILGGSRKLLTRAITTFPDFMLANALRDTASVFVLTGKTDPLAVMNGFVDAFKEGPTSRKMAVSGGDVIGYYDTTPESFSGQFRAMNSPKNLWKRAFEFWSRVGAATEAMNRQAVYNRVLEEGGSPAEAAFQARDLMDYSMRGDSAAAQFLSFTVPFFNARLQGLYKLGRGAAENPKGFVMRGALLTAASLAVLSQNMGEEWYEEIPAWERDNYMHYKVGDTILKLPRPFEAGAIFQTIPEQFVRWIAEEDEGGDVADTMLRMFANTFSFNPIPQAILPLVEQYTNKSFFTGAPIVSLGMERLRPQDQLKPETSGLGRWVADVVPEGTPVLSSPVRTDALVRGYMGTLGEYILAASLGVNDAIVGRATPAWDMEDWPFVGRFFQQGERRYTQHTAEFYELRKEFNQIVASARRMTEVGNVEEARELMRSRPDAFALARPFNRIAAAKSEINAQLRAIREDKTLSGEEKKRRIDPLLRRKADLDKAAITMQRQTEARVVN